MQTRLAVRNEIRKKTWRGSKKKNTLFHVIEKQPVTRNLVREFTEDNNRRWKMEGKERAVEAQMMCFNTDDP